MRWFTCFTYRHTLGRESSFNIFRHFPLLFTLELLPPISFYVDHRHSKLYVTSSSISDGTKSPELYSDVDDRAWLSSTWVARPTSVFCTPSSERSIFVKLPLPNLPKLSLGLWKSCVLSPSVHGSNALCHGPGPIHSKSSDHSLLYQTIFLRWVRDTRHSFWSGSLDQWWINSNVLLVIAYRKRNFSSWVGHDFNFSQLENSTGCVLWIYEARAITKDGEKCFSNQNHGPKLSHFQGRRIKKRVF